ncbi:PD-(D/E)XK nuclease-like domain-containing protein [Methylobacterium aquaticum]|uniref:PD-(D/E)XK nuclease-like domain-containing protein n=1 Tax=Methylobacterium aquaticum TaxID=270351 RepID=UPI003D1638DE
MIPDGLYFGLDEAEYHADLALGSSDLKRLATGPAEYWFGSRLNPDREAQETTPAQLLGKAVHRLVLEGKRSFAAAFERYPEGDDLLRTADDLAAWIKVRGPVPSWAKTKPQKIACILDMCEASGEDPPRILDAILAEAQADGRALLKGPDFDRIRAAAGSVLANPHLAQSFTGGASEVSLFWTDEIDGEPVRRKARFDYLKPRAIVDLKSISTGRRGRFPALCRRALAEWDYPVQAAAYLQARARLPEMVAAGRVFGDHDPAWLTRVAAAQDHAFVFVFWASGPVPLTWGTTLSPGNPVLDVAETTVRDALWTYVAARRAHGLDRPWIEHEPLNEISIDDLPGWWSR